MDSWSFWRDDPPRPGWTNMSIDMALLDRAERRGERWLRLYRWDPHCLSFGRHEPAVRRYDRPRIEASKLDVVRRPTGGRAVWHSRELTYSVASPGESFGSLQAAYVEIHMTLRNALDHLGFTAALAPRAPAATLESGPCFALAAGGEVLVNGRKVVGSAQLRKGDAFLQHGSILLEDDQSCVLDLTRDPRPHLPSGGPPPLFRLSLDRPPLQPVELSDALLGSASVRWGGCWSEVNSADEIIHDASDYFPHFRSSAWTWAR